MIDEPTRKPKILIVEDDSSTQYLIKIMVEKVDHWEPTAVSCGTHALEAFKEYDFDAIIMDLSMPEMGGIETTKRIRSLENEYGRKRTPIVAFTAYAREEDRQACLEAGCDDYIAKPGSLNKLVDAVKKHI